MRVVHDPSLICELLDVRRRIRETPALDNLPVSLAARYEDGE